MKLLVRPKGSLFSRTSALSIHQFHLVRSSVYLSTVFSVLLCCIIALYYQYVCLRPRYLSPATSRLQHNCIEQTCRASRSIQNANLFVYLTITHNIFVEFTLRLSSRKTNVSLYSHPLYHASQT